jgi:hypothetical protein
MSVLSRPDHLLSLREWDRRPDDNRFALDLTAPTTSRAQRP